MVELKRNSVNQWNRNILRSSILIGCCVAQHVITSDGNEKWHWKLLICVIVLVSLFSILDNFNFVKWFLGKYTLSLDNTVKLFKEVFLNIADKFFAWRLSKTICFEKCNHLIKNVSLSRSLLPSDKYACLFVERDFFLL